MDTLTAKPHVLKQANLSLIRKVIKQNNTATRAEIVSETRISSTTVRSLLAEMLQNGEIESIGYDKSSGGRKAERYSFKPDRYYGAALCITNHQIYGLLINVCGEIIEKKKLDAAHGDYEPAIFAYLDELVAKKELKSIGIGVPGVVGNNGSSYWIKSDAPGNLYKRNLGAALVKRYRLPLIMENDLNAIAIGFSRHHIKEHPVKNSENINMAYLYFEKDCVSAGFLMDGKVIRGHNHFAGEFGLIPIGHGKMLHDAVSSSKEITQYANLVIHIISWICGILNPQYIVLGGPYFRENCMDAVCHGLCSLLPKPMLAEILRSSSIWNDYYEGMAYLTAAKMFDEVQLIKK